MKRPNFFIIGAPKSGTTSIASWLSEHPSVFMSSPKEPGYFNTEQPQRLIKSLTEYERLFSGADCNKRVVGEASTGYLSSSCAVQNVLLYNDAARFMVCLRSPIEMVPSLHMQSLKTGRQAERSLELAWRAQQADKKLPIRVSQLNYGRTCMIGAQVERALSLVGSERLHIVWMEDLRRDVETVYADILGFLGLVHDGRTDFPAQNTRQVPRSRWLAATVRVVSRTLYRTSVADQLRPIGKIVGRMLNTYPKDSECQLNESFRQELHAFFRDDIQKLSTLLHRDLDHWIH